MEEDGDVMTKTAAKDEQVPDGVVVGDAVDQIEHHAGGVDQPAGNQPGETGRERKYYRLTPAGRRALHEKRDEWQRFTAAVSSVLGARHVTG